MQIQSVDINSISTDPKNARKHSAKNLKAIKGSLKEFGQQKPIVVGKKDKTIIAGNGTFAAAKALGWKKIDVVFTELDATKSKAFALADNRTAELAEWDDSFLSETLKELADLKFDLGEIGFDESFLKGKIELGNKGNIGDNDVPEVKKNIHNVQRGQVWKLGEHRLMCGDSTSEEDVAKLMDGNRAVFCFTSPPYSDQREYNGGKDLSTKKLAMFLKAPCNLFAVNLGMQRKSGEVFPYWDDYIAAAKEYGHKFLSWNVWDKGEAGSIGNQSAMFAITHEWIFVFGNEKKKLNKTVPNKSAGHNANHTGNRGVDGTIKKGMDCIVGSHSQMRTVYQCTPQKARDGIDHPARFPVEFPLGYIEACSNENEIIFEPFTGSGSTLIACEKTNRKCFAMELDEHYCSVIIERWQQFTGKKAQLLTEV